MKKYLIRVYEFDKDNPPYFSKSNLVITNQALDSKQALELAIKNIPDGLDIVALEINDLA